MNPQRASLSSPGISGRVKKYDQYVHRPGATLRKVRSSTISDVSRKEPISSGSNNNISAHKVLSPTNPPKPVLIKKSNNNTGNRAQYIAMYSVKNARVPHHTENQLAQQFSDEREVVYTPAKAKMTRMQRAMYVFGALVLLFSSVASIQTFITNQQAQEQIATLGVRTDEQGVSEGTGSEPSEGPVSNQAIAAYQVRNPEDPRYIRIPALGVFSRIKNLGIDSSGAVDAPWNINDAGWYNGSARPGNSIGSSLILGHVSGWTADGVFKQLQNLPIGAQFEIEKGSGEIITYEVVKSENIPLEQVNMAKVLSMEEPGKHDLKLMTCSGSYNRDTDTYEERYIVYAKPVI